MSDQTTSERKLPPYISVKTFLTFLEHLRAIGAMPSHIDKDVMRSLSGSTQSWLKASLRVMKLVNGSDEPTDRLAKLVAAEGEARKVLLRELFKDTYSFLDGKVDLQNTTPQKLRSAIVDLGAQGETVEKIVAFLIGFGKEAGVPLSPYLTKRASGPRRPRQKTAKKDAEVGSSNDGGVDDVTEEEPALAAMKTVTLPKAKGSLTLSGSFNPFDLSGEERELVYGIIDKMNAFAEKQEG